MRLLLDSHIVLWALTNDARLSLQARNLILDQNNELYVSSATIWEIAIKHGLKRSDVPFSGKDAVGYCRAAGYLFLDVRPEHAAATEALPPLHGDPFDRLLIAQARVEPLHLLTHDEVVASYGAGVLRV
ncbi:MAG: type II toxin-antitoxin system VapC family toxin [Pseudomonadota bacterium]|nr:type II toxin-antitoxin system VapC family toxin [Pseudomonadota bacterium]